MFMHHGKPTRTRYKRGRQRKCRRTNTSWNTRVAAATYCPMATATAATNSPPTVSATCFWDTPGGAVGGGSHDFIICDADEDTYVNTALAPDDDTLRFSTAGVEWMKMFVDDSTNHRIHVECNNGNLLMGTNDDFQGTNNTFIGDGTGLNVEWFTSGGAHDNTLLGYKAGETLWGGDRNTFLGSEAGRFSGKEVNNTCVGYQAGSRGNDNTAVGAYAGGGGGTRHNNTLVGQYSGNSLYGNDNVCIGESAGYGSNSSISKPINNSIFIGRSSGAQAEAVINGIYIGDGSGVDSEHAQYNICIGDNSGTHLWSSNDNIFIGNSAGTETTDGFENICIGKEAGADANRFQNNIILGKQAAYNMDGTFGEEVSNNIIIGNEAGYQNADNDNILIGTEAGYYNYGNQNVFIGEDAGRSNGAFANVFFGTFFWTGKRFGEQQHLCGKLFRLFE